MRYIYVDSSKSLHTLRLLATSEVTSSVGQFLVLLAVKNLRVPFTSSGVTVAECRDQSRIRTPATGNLRQ